MATYLKTPTLTPKFRGQRAAIVALLLAPNAPKDGFTPEMLAKAVDADGSYSKTFKPSSTLDKPWAIAKAHGVLGSVKYHLRGLVELGMVTKSGEEAPAAPKVEAPKTEAVAPKAKAPKAAKKAA